MKLRLFFINSYLILCLFVFCIFSCNSEDNSNPSILKPNNNNKTSDYIVIDSLVITLPENFKEDFFTSILIQPISLNNIQYFVIPDFKNNELYLYNLETNKVEKKINLGLVNQISDFYLLDTNNIYLLTTFPNYLIHKKYKNFDLIQTDTIIDGIATYPFIGDRLNVLCDNRDTFIVSNNFLRSKFRYANVSLVAKKSKKSFYYFNRFEYENKFPLLNFPAKFEHDDKIFIALGYKNYVNVYDYNSGKHLSVSWMKSNYLNDTIYGIPNESNPEFQTENNYIISQGYYLGLFNDVLNRSLYRIVKHPQKLKMSNGMLNERYSGAWSIIKSDYDFKNISEVIMPKNKYKFYKIIPVKKGILIPLISPEHTNVLKFHLIKIVK